MVLNFKILVRSYVFFFSSRRRHTRWNCDWSSDVCSSDLGEPEGFVIRAAQHTAVAVGLVGLAPLGLPHQAQLVDLSNGETERRVALLHGERVAPEPDEMQVPEDPPVVERHLPAVVPLGLEGRGTEQDHPREPEGSHCPSAFAAFAASAAFFFSFFFLGRVTPYVPRRILPRLLRMSPLPMKPPLFSAAEFEDAFELIRRCRHDR